MNSLPLSPVVISYANSPGKHYSAKLVPMPFPAVQKFFLVIFDLTRKATLRADIKYVAYARDSVAQRSPSSEKV